MAIRIGRASSVINLRLKKLYPDKKERWERFKEFSDEDYEKIKLMGRQK